MAHWPEMGWTKNLKTIVVTNSSKLWDISQRKYTCSCSIIACFGRIFQNKLLFWENSFRSFFKLMKELFTGWKVSVFGVILVRIFPHSDWIRWDTPYLSVFSPNEGKCRPEQLRIRTLFTQCATNPYKEDILRIALFARNFDPSIISLFLTNVPPLHPQETSENRRFSGGM